MTSINWRFWILTLVVLVISYFTISSDLKTLDQTEEFLVFEIIFTIGDWILRILLVAIAIYSAFVLNKTKKLRFLLPLVISIISLVFIGLIWNKFTSREASPVILKAHYDGDINGMTLYLRKNKTYKIDDFSFMGGTNNYGEYSMRGDTIILSKKYPLGANRDIMSSKLLKKADHILIKQDSNGRYSELEYIKLRIVE